MSSGMVIVASTMCGKDGTVGAGDGSRVGASAEEAAAAALLCLRVFVMAREPGFARGGGRDTRAEYCSRIRHELFATVWPTPCDPNSAKYPGARSLGNSFDTWEERGIKACLLETAMV